jgi:hypothetical protein
MLSVGGSTDAAISGYLITHAPVEHASSRTRSLRELEEPIQNNEGSNSNPFHV